LLLAPTRVTPPAAEGSGRGLSGFPIFLPIEKEFLESIKALEKTVEKKIETT